MKNKKSQTPTIKTIIILIISISILLTYMIILSSNKINLDDKKLNTQILIKEIFNKNCFSNKYGEIDKNKFTQEKANNCLNNIDSLNAMLVIKGLEPIYIGNKEEFEKKSQLAEFKNNNLYSKLIYPIILKDENKIILNNLIIYTISS